MKRINLKYLRLVYFCYKVQCRLKLILTLVQAYIVNILIECKLL